jgi:ATP-dependent helicase/nuclease subunit A
MAQPLGRDPALREQILDVTKAGPASGLASAAVTDLSDAEARRRIRKEFGATVFIEAAAGTGKATALVARIVGLIGAGAGTLDRIVAVTFTEPAAGEMKLRLRSDIERAMSKATREERGRLDQAPEELELARIARSRFLRRSPP